MPPAFQHDGDALIDADAHRAQRMLLTDAVQLVDRCRGQARADGSERVAERHRATVRIAAVVIVGLGKTLRFGHPHEGVDGQEAVYGWKS